jgi:hypothetical protein
LAGVATVAVASWVTNHAISMLPLATVGSVTLSGDPDVVVALWAVPATAIGSITYGVGSERSSSRSSR